jgi:hypothetical protein
MRCKAKEEKKKKGKIGNFLFMASIDYGRETP